MKISIVIKSILILIIVLINGCGSSSTNPNNGNPTEPTSGSFVGLGLYDNSQAYSAGMVHDWTLNIDDMTQTFTASESTTGASIAGDINSTGAYIFFNITTSNHTTYPVGMEFDGVGIGDKIVFLHFPDHQSNRAEFTTLIKQDSCPTSDLSMVWHRMMSQVLVNPWALNDVISNLEYTLSTSTLLSTNSWTTQAGISLFPEASFLTTPTTLTCNNGAIQGTQVEQFGTNLYNGYMTSDGYSITTNPNWSNIELGLPKKPIDNINALTGNYTGYLVVNTGNAYGFKGENNLLTAHLDFSSVGAVSSILTLSANSFNNLGIGYLNITTTGNTNQPIDGEINGEFNIFTLNNANHPLLTEPLPLGNTLITQTVDQTLADFRGNISCSGYENVDNTNKNLVVCEAHAHSTDNPITGNTKSTQDNLFTLVFVTGSYIPEDPCQNNGCEL